MTDRLARINARRAAQNLSLEALARLAGVSERTVRRVLREGYPASDRLLGALEQALVGARRGQSIASPARAAYRMALVLLAGEMGVPMTEIDADTADPKRKATNNADWMRAAVVRRRAIYTLNTICGYPQHELVAVSGLTPAGVSRICREIEDERDEDEALNRRLDTLAREIAGGV